MKSTPPCMFLFACLAQRLSMAASSAISHPRRAPIARSTRKLRVPLREEIGGASWVPQAPRISWADGPISGWWLALECHEPWRSAEFKAVGGERRRVVVLVRNHVAGGNISSSAFEFGSATPSPCARNFLKCASLESRQLCRYLPPGARCRGRGSGDFSVSLLFMGKRVGLRCARPSEDSNSPPNPKS